MRDGAGRGPQATQAQGEEGAAPGAAARDSAEASASEEEGDAQIEAALGSGPMGLDVFAVRCHAHNISHTGPCPKCEAERAERYAAEQRERREQREQPAPDDCAACSRARAMQLPPVLQLPREEPDPNEPTHVRKARERAAAVAALLSGSTLDQLSALLTELHTLQVAKDGTLHRWELTPIHIAAAVTCRIDLPVRESAKLIRLDVSADEGQQALELVRVRCIRVGTRTIGEGGTLAQLNRCPLARLMMTPSVGAMLLVENLNAQAITLRGVMLAERFVPRAGP